MGRFSGLKTLFQSIREVRVRRHWKRLRARWRLHRIEWNGRMRPLEPPPGYEHYYSPEELFPGLKGIGPPPKNFREWLERVRFALRLYKHHYFPDPELTKIEEILYKEQGVDVEKTVQRLRKVVQDSKKDMNKYKRQVEQVVDNFTDNLQEKVRENRPAAEEMFKNRMEVLKASMLEFSSGYKEGLDGSVQWMKFLNTDEEDNLDAFQSRPDNRPIRYEAQEQAERKPDEG